MTQIASEDYDNLLIYLHVDTVTQGFDPALMQQEHRERRRLDAGGERRYDPMVTFSGLESTGGGTFTPPSTRLRAGVRIVPFDTPHSLTIKSQILNIDDGLKDVAVMDRSSVASNVDVDVGYSPVEVIVVTTGSGVLPSDVTDIVNGVWNYTGP